MPVLYHLNEWSKQLYKEISLNPDFDFGFEERGLLMLYKTEKQAREEEELAEKAHQLGVNAAIMDLPRLKTLEPEMDLDVLGGIYFPGDAHLYPNRFIRQMIAALKQRGVQFLVNTEIVDFNVSGRQITSLTSRSGQEIKVQNVLLTTGAWTGHLLKKLGIKIHLIAGKGYSITIKKPGLRPCIPTLLSEAKVALTPMGDDLRIGGTLELSGVSDHINQRRLSGIMESIPAYYRNLEVPFSPSTKIWQGYRPCTPDGMPYIGKSSQLSNMILGTGHGTMGMSLGPATSKLISQIMTEQDTEIDLHAFRLNRFK
ncbi:MAG: hypothetical protein DHS20C18_02140 [Saprospiraceae bacterium]|nr:MAG: hypothetical protein DHS20C18_02140 [Saprospiraceae bacterium]